HRDGPHLPAGPQVRRGAGPAGARRQRQAGHGHDGVLRRRDQPGRGGHRREQPRRAGPVLAPGGRSRRRPRRGHRQGRVGLHRGRAARRRAGAPRPGGGLRRPAQGLARGEVQGLRAARRPDHRRGRQGPGPGHGRDQGPPHRGAAGGPRRLRCRRGPRRGAPRPVVTTCRAPVGAVIFDWGGTLTPWRTIDLAAQWRVFAEALHADADDLAAAAELAQAILAAEQRAWERGRTSHESARLEEILTDAGVDPAHPALTAAHAAYEGFWEPYTRTDPLVRPVWEWLRGTGIRVGVLSNTIWSRD